jgi:hypothetical protein
MEVNEGGANLLRLHIQVEQLEPVPKNILIFGLKNLYKKLYYVERT